ncbi:MAG: hypothetical protein ACI9AD_001475 [Nitriliruptoraceae bacterium]
MRRACTVTKMPPLASARTTIYHKPQCVHPPAHWQQSVLIVIDLVNLADSPALTIEAVVDEMVAQSADLVFATSNEMKDGTLQAATGPRRSRDLALA